MPYHLTAKTKLSQSQSISSKGIASDEDKLTACINEGYNPEECCKQYYPICEPEACLIDSESLECEMARDCRKHPYLPKCERKEGPPMVLFWEVIYEIET